GRGSVLGAGKEVRRRASAKACMKSIEVATDFGRDRGFDAFPESRIAWLAVWSREAATLERCGHELLAPFAKFSKRAPSRLVRGALDRGRNAPCESHGPLPLDGHDVHGARGPVALAQRPKTS